jgi:hypothetical protein
MIKTITYHTDPSHGWIKVSLKDKVLQSILKEVSPFSYVSNTSIFLEEDCDASLYIQKLKDLNIPYKFKTMHTNRRSKIRAYHRYCSITNQAVNKLELAKVERITI